MATTGVTASPVPEDPVVMVDNFTFDYGAAAGFKPILHNISLSLPKGSRTLLVGDNGAGKSTLLRILAGKHIHPLGKVKILGRESFYDTTLNFHRAYLATDWGRKNVAFVGHSVPLQADMPVHEMMSGVQEQYKDRRDMLVELLGVDLNWRMHQLSDGQRRRVQIMLQLLRPVGILFLDEITTDLDLITRHDFLQYLKHISETEQVTIVYATHIFDGLDEWPTHICYLHDGRISKLKPVVEFDDFMARKTAGVVAPLLRTIEDWMRKDRNIKKAAGQSIVEQAARHDNELRGKGGNGYLSGRFSMGYN